MTEEPEIIAEAPKRDFYFSFTDEAAAATALQPFYFQPQVQSVDPETGEKLFDAETGEPIMENDGDAYLVTGSADHAFDIVGLIHKATGNMLRRRRHGIPRDGPGRWLARQPAHSWRLHARRGRGHRCGIWSGTCYSSPYLALEAGSNSD